MGDDDHGGRALPVDLLEGLGQPGEGPQVDAGLRLIEDHQLAAAGQDGGDLDALDLAAGQRHVHLAVQVVVGAEANLGKIGAALVLAELVLARRQKQQVVDGDALEAGRLLEAVADAALGALGDGQVRHVLAVVQHAAGGGLHQAHDDLGQGGLAAAVGAGEDDQLMVGDGDGYVFQDVLLPLGGGHPVADILQFQHGMVLPSLNVCIVAVHTIKVVGRFRNHISVTDFGRKCNMFPPMAHIGPRHHIV